MPLLLLPCRLACMRNEHNLLRRPSKVTICFVLPVSQKNIYSVCLLSYFFFFFFEFLLSSFFFLTEKEAPSSSKTPNQMFLRSGPKVELTLEPSTDVETH